MNDRCTCHDTLIVKNLNRWFKEKWVDVSRKDPKTGKHPPCGRSKAKKGSKGYPKCRPSVRVSSKTPKTSGEMTSGQKRAATKRKRAKRQGVGGKPTVVKSVLVKAPRIPRKKGQPAGSKKHSDLYTDENPKGTIHGLGFKDPAKARQSVSKIKNSSRSHAHKTQAAIAMEQRAREMGKTREAGVYRNFIEQQKKKTKQMKKSVLVLKQGEFPENMPGAAPELISVGSMLGVDAPETCTIPGCNNPPMMKARYANPLRSVDYTHHMCTEHAMQYEPDLAQVLVKSPVSPEAKRHKLEYDKKYESTPERVKYREELNRERRRRGIYGKGGPDMSHTKRHTLVAEDPHTNRARHFKERGTLKSTKPIDRELVLVTTGRL